MNPTPRTFIIATTNTNKITRLKELLSDQPFTFLPLSELGENIPEPEETAQTCIGIAAQKALWYVEYADGNVPVLTQDDTVSFAGINAADDPGTFIKQPVIDAFGTFTDENAVKYYTQLAKKYGGCIDTTFEYGNAVAIKDANDPTQYRIFSSKSTLKARLVDEARGVGKMPGYFMTAIVQVEVDGEWIYYTELTERQRVAVDKDLRRSVLGLMDSIADGSF